ncbi:hypothetical protein RclHR1_01870004 [Rhizophagus clarus]|uniref:Protein kinase domain-containing protein n=1 Tax=Rhizophagus clarus TaxID=94130 RepID=A0A2Z6R064_9GLOM|nr:hypothetical protein RclHR1_01870004 [Rhizophagus clarus]
MTDLSYDFGICPACNKKREAFAWCVNCDVRQLEKNFNLWTSGDPGIDDFIKYTQRNSTRGMDYLEWIDYNQFSHINNTGKAGAFASNYSAIWVKGPKCLADNGRSWIRCGPIQVILKQFLPVFEKSEKSLSQLYKYHKCFIEGSLADFYGFSRDERTSRFFIVMKEFNCGDLYSVMDTQGEVLCWRDVVEILSQISEGLFKIHQMGLTHGNLHGGNILIEQDEIMMHARIADTGLCGDLIMEKVFGVIPFVAPEIFNGYEKTQASDIYSFGMLMMMLLSGLRPFHDRSHDSQLIEDIKRGLKPYYSNKTPQVYLQLMTRCWDNNPNARPSAMELHKTISGWLYALCYDIQVNELSEQFDTAEEIKYLFLDSPTTVRTIHHNAIYVSRDIFSI